MVAMTHVTEFVHNGVFQDRLRREDQVPVEIDHAIPAATAPEVLLILDANGLRFQAVRLSMFTDKRSGIFRETLPKPEPERRFDERVTRVLRDRAGAADNEPVAIRDIDKGLLGRLDR